MGEDTTLKLGVNTFGPQRPSFTPEEDDTWRLEAACIGQSDLFFVERGESTRPAKAICAVCPVIEPCLDYALASSAHQGVWGGLSERERRKVRFKRRTDL